MCGLRRDDDFLEKFHINIQRNDGYFHLKNEKKVGRKPEKIDASGFAIELAVPMGG